MTVDLGLSKSLKTFFFKDFIYLFMRDRGRDRDRDRERSRLLTGSLMRDSIPETRDHTLGQRPTLNR